MKGIQGLILAIGLGVAGAMFNWAYLHRASSAMKEIQFIGINPDVTVNRGERLTKEHLVPVGIPERNVKNLVDFAYLYSDVQTVIGMPVHRTLPGGSLLLQEDMRAPPPEIQFNTPLGEGEVERGIFVPFETRNFVPSLVNPGDYVDFVVGRGGPGVPTPAAGGQPGGPAAGPEIIGPFKVLSLGNRLGSVEVMRAAGMTPTQENVMLISVKLKDGKMEPKAQQLWDVLQRTNFQQVGIMIRPRESGK